MRIPFDSVSLAAVVSEAQVLVGKPLKRVAQTGAMTFVLECGGNVESHFLICGDPKYCRAHLVARRSGGTKQVSPFIVDLRKHLVESNIVFVRQRGLDRVLEIGFDGPEGTFQLVAELMGKHANVMLVNKDRSVVAALKWIEPSKSKRPILPGKPYSAPPFEPRSSFLVAKMGDKLSDFEGVSPLLVKVIQAGTVLETIQQIVRGSNWSPVYVPGVGAYPLSISSLGLAEVSRESLSYSLEQHFAEIVEADRFTTERNTLTSQLERVLLARELALSDIDEALATARDARAIQMKAELILAYQSQIEPGSDALETMDYEGQPLKVKLVADLTPLENAERYFQKAKKAKSRASEMEIHQERLHQDLEVLRTQLTILQEARNYADIQEVRTIADKRRWLQRSGEAKPKEDRPFEGFAVRELLSPNGWRVLYGDNSTSNDYLTSRVAKPSDLWFHVRGAPSAHVVLCTNNQPTKVQSDDLVFAAKVAVSHSPQKHSSYVSVDYTQKRYVRKPRGSAAGLAVYTNEKTIHVTSD